jgi:hypothetical protein
MVINRVGPLSCAKIAGTLYAILGLIIGACFSLFALAGMSSDRTGGAMFGVLLGVGAIVALPIFYGIIGFIGTIIMGWLYNVAAGIVGGVEIDVR